MAPESWFLDKDNCLQDMREAIVASPHADVAAAADTTTSG
jgi:hypothetical protein